MEPFKHKEAKKSIDHRHNIAVAKVRTRTRRETAEVPLPSDTETVAGVERLTDNALALSEQPTVWVTVTIWTGVIIDASAVSWLWLGAGVPIGSMVGFQRGLAVGLAVELEPAGGLRAGDAVKLAAGLILGILLRLVLISALETECSSLSVRPMPLRFAFSINSFILSPGFSANTMPAWQWDKGWFCLQKNHCGSREFTVMVKVRSFLSWGLYWLKPVSNPPIGEHGFLKLDCVNVWFRL